LTLLLVSLLVPLSGCAARPLAPPTPRAKSLVPQAPPESLATRLLLIGDAGAAAAEGEPVLTALATAAAVDPAHTLVLFLGDDVYPHGTPDSSASDWPEAMRRLDAQLAVLRSTGAHGIFLPGNHDWDRGAEGVRRLGRLVAAHAAGLAQVLPANACPGPAIVDPGPDTPLRLILLDTAWWLYGGAKPVGPESGCAAPSEHAVLDSVRSALHTAGRRQAVVLAHHPLMSGGPHGGHFRWQDHVFPLRAWRGWMWVPLPLLGSVYPEARLHGISNEDVSGPRNRAMREGLEQAFAERAPLLYASGHDHGLQILTGTSARYLVVSGAGTFGHLSQVDSLNTTRFARRASGFMRLEVLHNGTARLGAIVVNAGGEAAEAFALWLD